LTTLRVTTDQTNNWSVVWGLCPKLSASDTNVHGNIAYTNLEIRGKGDIARVVNQVGVNPCTLFEIVEQLSNEFIQQTEAVPLAVTAVAGLVGGVASGEVVPRGVTRELPKNSIENGALVEGWAAAQVRRWQRFSVARELLLGDPAGRCKTQWL